LRQLLTARQEVNRHLYWFLNSALYALHTAKFPRIFNSRDFVRKNRVIYYRLQGTTITVNNFLSTLRKKFLCSNSIVTRWSSHITVH